MKRLFGRGRQRADRVDLREPAAREFVRKLERLVDTGGTRLARTYASAPEIWLSELGQLAEDPLAPLGMSDLRYEAEELADALAEMVEDQPTPDWTVANPDVVRAIAFGVAWEMCVPFSAPMGYQWGLYLTLIMERGLNPKKGGGG